MALSATDPGTARPNAHPKESMTSTLQRPSVAPAAPPAGSSSPAPAPAPIAAVPARPPAAQRPNRIPMLVLGTLALVGLAFGIVRWRWGLTHVSTDDAQLEGQRALGAVQ